jgi:5-enolpyruvylshikimate-3-phosphate synthase
VLAALATGPSTITNGLDARDTRLMRDGLRTLGVTVDDSTDTWRITPPATFVGGGTVDCGLAGTVLRFVPPVEMRFGGPQRPQERPEGPVVWVLRNGTATPLSVETHGTDGRSTAIGGRDVTEGMEVITGLARPATGAPR